jgi:hypothetical protein
MHVQEFLEWLPTYRRNAWLFFRRYRDREELIQNAIGNAWIALCRTGKRPRFRLCCFNALNQWFRVRALSHYYTPGSRLLRPEPQQLQGDVGARNQPAPWLLAHLRLEWPRWLKGLRRRDRIGLQRALRFRHRVLGKHFATSGQPGVRGTHQLLKTNRPTSMHVGQAWRKTSAEVFRGLERLVLRWFLGQPLMSGQK